MKAIKIQVGNIQEIERNWRLIKPYESNGDSKSIEANGSRRQVTKYELESWIFLGIGNNNYIKIFKNTPFKFKTNVTYKTIINFFESIDGCQMWMGYFIFSILLLLLNLHYFYYFLM